MGNTPDIFEKMPEISHAWSLGLLFWAILIGLFLSVVVNMGPAFITLVQTSLHRGFRSAGWFATGVILNDALIVSLCIMTSVQVVTRTGFESALACIGAGMILLLFGIVTFRKKGKSQEQREQIMAESSEKILKNLNDNPSWYVFLGKGFVFNILNPFVWMLWFSAVAIAAGKMGGNKINTLVFFGIILGTTYAIELLKAWGAAKLQKFLTPERCTTINRIAGAMITLFGAYFIIFRGIAHLI